MSEPAFRIGADGVDEAEASERCLAANAERRARGVIEPGEPERVGALGLEITAVSGPGHARIVEALRLMQRAVRVDEAYPITSHRPIAGPVFVVVKRVVRRILRFETAEPWARQAEFNRGVVSFTRAILAELARIEGAAKAGEEPAKGPAAGAGGAARDER